MLAQDLGERDAKIAVASLVALLRQKLQQFSWDVGRKGDHALAAQAISLRALMCRMSVFSFLF